MVFRAARGLVVCLSMMGSLGACDKKTKECNSVVEAVNGVEARAKARVPNDAKADALALKGIADAEEAAAGELGKARTTAPELGDLKTKFQEALAANAVASRDLATELEHIPDAAGEKAIAEKSNAARDAIEAAEGRIAARCGDDAAACTPFAAMLKKHPDPDAIDANDPAKTKAWANAVGAWSAELAITETQVKDAELKLELDKLRKGYTDLAEVIDDLARMSSRTRTAQDAQTKSAKDIAALIEELNKFCQAP
jgi:hypothetical protein